MASSKEKGLPAEIHTILLFEGVGLELFDNHVLGVDVRTRIVFEPGGEVVRGVCVCRSS